VAKRCRRLLSAQYWARLLRKVLGQYQYHSILASIGQYPIPKYWYRSNPNFTSSGSLGSLGPCTECKNHRPITLLSVPDKVFTHVLLTRLEPLLHRKRPPQQSGFTKNRSTLDVILALCLLSEIHQKFQKPLNAAYIDLKAAFDSVDISALWKALCVTGLPNTLVDRLRALHDGITSRACHGCQAHSSQHLVSGKAASLRLQCFAVQWTSLCHVWLMSLVVSI